MSAILLVKLNRLQSKHLNSCRRPPCPKWPQLDQLDNGSNSTIQLTHISTSNMEIEVGLAIFELFDFFESKNDPDYTPKFSANL